VDFTSTLTGLQKTLKGNRTSGGLDIVYTKLAVDLQHLTQSNADEKIASCLDILRDSAGCDVACFVTFDTDNECIGRVHFSQTDFTTINAEQLEGEPLSDYPFVTSQLGPLRVLELSDTSHTTGPSAQDGQQLSKHGIAAALVVGITINNKPAGFLSFLHGQVMSKWEADHYLLLKLLGSSLVSGLERLFYEQELIERNEMRDMIVATAHDGMWNFDALNNVIHFSPQWKAMMGYSDEDLAESRPDWRRMIHQEDLARVQAGLRAHLAGETDVFESTHRLQRRDGEWRWMECKIKALTDEDGRLRRLVGNEYDITERKIYEEALFREKESAQITLQSIGDGVATTDAEGCVEYLNPVAQELTGWRVEDAVGRPLEEIFRGFHEETCEPLENPLSQAMERNRAIKSVRPTLLIRRDGNELYVESTASPIRNDKGEVNGGVLVFHDVSESRELNRRLSYHASHDILTGLVNRREFESRVDRGLKSTLAGEASYALLYLDLDRFKIINDTCGHQAGDTLLGQLGALLKGRIRWRDCLARLGGDEFAILLESCSLDEAMRTAEGLVEAIDDFEFNWEDRSFKLTVSIGVVPISPEATDVAAVLTAADSACQAAKESGRNRVHSYEENDIDLMRRRREIQWAARINNALEDNRFELFRQTILPLQVEDQGEHYELLLRMRDENGSLVSPDLFITAAERYGIMPKVDRWVVSNALRWLVSEADERERLSLCSINLSGQSLTDDKFLPFVINEFKLSGLDPTLICFEITETSAIASYAQASRFINALKELGCLFALDDFGTGLSSFGYLKHFPVDFLKIDGIFVKEMLHDPIDREMVRSINEIGHLTKKKTIAEFAENEEIITMLRGMGIDYAQGYGIDEPQRILKAAYDANDA
jgi:diguanylate cyclase (GGDEF)-like protein/PAS domain S-box-containing protein